MALINLKFSPEMEELILQGKKCCTTRDDKKGDTGDIFVVGNRVYRIIEIEEICIDVGVSFYKQEGFESSMKYRDCIKFIYPGASRLYLHWFAYVGDWCPQFGVSCAACSNPEEFCELYPDCVKEREL